MSPPARSMLPPAARRSFLSPVLRLCLSAAGAMIGCAAGEAAPRPPLVLPPLRVAVLQDALPGTDVNAVAGIVRLLRRDGMAVSPLSGAEVCDPARLSSRQHDLLVVPNAEMYPRGGFSVLGRYLDEGGHLLLLGGPAFRCPVWRHKGVWVDRRGIDTVVAGTRPTRLLMVFDEGPGPAGWRRATNDKSRSGHLVRVAGGRSGTGGCLEYSSAMRNGWDTWYSPDLERAFPEGHDLFCLAARGDGDTPQMAVELVEKDGSRWVAVVSLTTAWQFHALGPGRFCYWYDSPTGRRRGQTGDSVRMAGVKQINFGLSSTHTPRSAGGGHRFWVDDVGTAPHPYGDCVEPAGSNPPVIESVSPPYKVFRSVDALKLRATMLQSSAAVDLRADAPEQLICSHPRPVGKGTGLNLPFRWVPLLEALDAEGGFRGTAGWMLIAVDPLVRGNVLSFGFRETDLFGKNALEADDKLQQVVLASIRWLRRGVCFAEAGTDRRTCRAGEAVNVGFKVLSKAPTPEGLAVRIRISESGSAEALLDEIVPVEVAPYNVFTASTRWHRGMSGRDYVVRCDLLQSEQIVDSIEHGFSVLEETPHPADAFVTVQGGDFYLRGRKWHPVGVNYWPLYVAGLERDDYFGHWLQRRWYDGEAIESDLRMMASLGINLVSIQWLHGDELRNLLDFLRRCGRYGIKANLFVTWASPLHFEQKQAEFRKLVTAGRLAENANIFAYDIIWEPGNHLFHVKHRGRWDGEWNRWLADRYGSVADAERDWGSPVPRKDGKPTSPTDRQLREDGAWRRLVAAYRRFMDDLMSRKWNDAVTTLRDIDPHHLVSFRQGNTLPHDFTLTATVKHIDFICPEGYAIRNSQAGYDAACFITRFVHFTTGGKPIVWSEFGKSVWDTQGMRPSPGLMAVQSEYHDLFYRMVLETGANGTVPWWWPGGYRVDERSDFGIMNPDGTPRASARLIARYAERIKQDRPWPEPGAWFTFDRDAHPGGYWHVAFNDGARACAQARREGKALGIRTAGTGTTSCDVPLVAVGNTPCTGKNPPKYLNAEFNRVWVRCGGAWRRVAPGSRVAVPRNVSVRARVSIGNLQEAEWICPSEAGAEPGGVFVVSAPGSQVEVRAPIKANTAYLQDAETAEFTLTGGLSADAGVVLHMSADRRATFGEKLRFTLVPREP
jgi:hypothetical protein